MLMKKSCYLVILFCIWLRDPFGNMHDPILVSSADCKRATSVNIGTNMTRLQSVLETQWVANITKRVTQPNSKQISAKTKIPLELISPLSWCDYHERDKCLVWFVCLFVFHVPSTARSFRDGTPFTVPCEGRVLHESKTRRKQDLSSL